MTDRTDRRDRRGRRQRVAVATAGLALAGLLAATARGASSDEDDREPPAVGLLRAEIDAMVARGVPADDPKLEMLEADADALAEAWGDEGRPEPGVDLEADADAGDLASTPDEARRLADEVRARSGAGPGGQPADAGSVECEPVPGRLTAEEVAGADCLSVPQPDGSSRYVAVTPSGAVHVVEFGPGGEVRRLADAQLPAGVRPAAARLSPDPGGGLRIESPTTPPTALDLG